jgi:small GTP-binding protein
MSKSRCDIVLLGAVSVGKSSLINRVNKNKFDEYECSTIGTSFMSVNYKGNMLYVWDTAGADRFSSILPMYIRKADVILVCYDSKNSSSVKKYFDQASKINLSAKIFLVKTKVDNNLEEEEKSYKIDEVDHRVYITSSKTGRGIDELFDDVCLCSKQKPIIPSKIVNLQIPKKKWCWY